MSNGMQFIRLCEGAAMNIRKTLGFGIATVVAAGILSTSASAVTASGNNSQKGSLLIYPQISAGPGTDTLITLTNDGAASVVVKCFYASSDPLPTPYTGTAAGARILKHSGDFTIALSRNQPFAWWASTGKPYSYGNSLGSVVAPPFGVFPDGATRQGGELKCWAVTDDVRNEKSHNHLYGTASVVRTATGQTSEYTAWAFRAMAAEGSRLGSRGVLNLNNKEYDACPSTLLGNFLASGGSVANGTEVTLASCNQDLRQAFTPTITKLMWTFFNQDEVMFTGTRGCADSWFETNFPVANFPFATFAYLRTEVAYFRIDTAADTNICGPSAVKSAYVGVINQVDAAGSFRATNLTGNGSAFAVIKYDTAP
jgi:hypothetical protein